MQRKITSEILEQARVLRAPPEELGIREAAERLGVGKSQLAAALAPSKAAAPAAKSRPIRKPEAAASASPARAIAHPSPPPPNPPPPPAPRAPAPPPAVLDADPVAELLAVAAELRGRMVGLPPGSADFRALAAEVRKVLGQVAALQAKRPPKPGDDEIVAKARPKAEEVLGKIRSGVVAVARREAETGCCARCAGSLPPELVMRRRVEGGMFAAAIA